MKKEITEITFADGTKGTITTETITGRVDVKATYNNMTEFYYAERKGNNWIVFCNDAVIMVNTKTRSAAISEIIQNVKRNQSITDYSAELPTPSDEPKTEEEEEAAAEHFVKQMSEPEPDVNTMIIKQNLNSYYGMTVNHKSEYMGTEYMDARLLNNWKDLLIEKKYGMVREHDKIYCVTSYGKASGWFWNVKGAQQFQGLYGGDIGLVDSDLFFIEQIHDKFLEIICTVETDELSIESQLIYAGYLHTKENRPSYIFECLQSYTNCFELDMMVREHHMQQHDLSIQNFLKCTYRDLANNKDYEKSLLAFCKDMQYLTEQIIAFELSEKEGANNDNT